MQGSLLFENLCNAPGIMVPLPIVGGLFPVSLDQSIDPDNEVRVDEAFHLRVS